MPVMMIVDDLQSTLVNSLQDVADSLDIDTTQNAGAACAEVTILFSRGTDEPGNVGVLTGPAFFDAVQEKLGGQGRVAVQGTNNCE